MPEEELFTQRAHGAGVARDKSVTHSKWCVSEGHWLLAVVQPAEGSEKADAYERCSMSCTRGFGAPTRVSLQGAPITVRLLQAWWLSRGLPSCCLLMMLAVLPALQLVRHGRVCLLCVLTH